MGALEYSRLKAAERIKWPVFRRRTSHVIWGSVLPAALFQIILIGKLMSLGQRISIGAQAEPPFLFSASVLQQLLAILFLALMVVLFVVRRPVAGQRSGRIRAFVAVTGSFVMSIPASPPVTGEIVPLLVASSVLVVVGTLWSIVSLAYLGRCFGIFPEARGLVTRGPYRWIRPLYLGEITSSLGLVVASASPILFGVFIVFCGFQYWRARLEERVLTEAFPDYATYALRTARILPGLH